MTQKSRGVKLLICNCMLFLSASSFAQLFDSIITTQSGVEYLIDPASIVRSGDIVAYTQMVNYPNGYSDSLPAIHSIKQSRQINCSSNMIKTSTMIAYEEKNAFGAISTLSVGREYDWLKINNNSVSKVFEEMVCK